MANREWFPWYWTSWWISPRWGIPPFPAEPPLSSWRFSGKRCKQEAFLEGLPTRLATPSGLVQSSLPQDVGKLCTMVLDAGFLSPSLHYRGDSSIPRIRQRRRFVIQYYLHLISQPSPTVYLCFTVSPLEPVRWYALAPWTLKLVNPPRSFLSPLWDWVVVLAALGEPPYEPLEKASFKYQNTFDGFFLVITSVRRVSEL